MYSEVFIRFIIIGDTLGPLHSSKIMNLDDFSDEEVYGVLFKKKTAGRVFFPKDNFINYI